ncbi:unnamed protein product [Protopolystoma xenopodis]|uniref:Uncharacterized protein n=1 Tax=Protopolystoma xenopodis TaxID=117903 RepID=A0A3S5AA59_9PLAT|nr:unnamed protein product [Protopolystoma xenopodis]
MNEDKKVFFRNAKRFRHLAYPLGVFHRSPADQVHQLAHPLFESRQPEAYSRPRRPPSLHHVANREHTTHRRPVPRRADFLSGGSRSVESAGGRFARFLPVLTRRTPSLRTGRRRRSVALRTDDAGLYSDAVSGATGATGTCARFRPPRGRVPLRVKQNVCSHRKPIKRLSARRDLAPASAERLQQAAMLLDQSANLGSNFTALHAPIEVVT